jgi:hypothetical protein
MAEFKTEEDVKVLFKKATEVFDELSEAIYYGFAFRQMLANDPVAMTYVTKLLERFDHPKKK